MKAECTQHRGRFSEYLDGELSPRERAALEAHLEQCDHCRAELDLWRRTVRAVADLPAVGAPEEFRARVLERVRGREARRGIGRVFVRALPVAAMFLLVVGLTFMVRRDGDIARAPAPERLAMVREKAAADAAGVEAAEKGRGLPELEEALGAGFAGGEQLRGARPAPVAPAEELPRRPTLEKSFAGRPVDAMKRQAATPVATVEPMARPVGAREPDQGAFLFTQSAEAPEAVRPMPQQVLTIRWRDPAALMHRTVALANDYGTNVVLELKEEGAADIQVE
ncbi:MAG: zf-HC2 domain-containing protein, partial [Candidatus Brocadiaceae bacterium]